MKCPYCFKVTHIKPQKKKGSRLVNYCAHCKTEVPKTYLDSLDIPYLKIGMVGYSGHGKTTYLNSLLYGLKYLHNYWEQFYFETLDDTSHAAMYYSASKLETGKMPAQTKAIFPRPVFMRLNHTPGFNTRFVSLFDTGGELFDNLDLMTRRGRYLSYSDVVFFFISLTEEDMTDNWNIKITKLLDRYINVVYSRYGVKTAKKQNVAFVFTKADELMKNDEEYGIAEEITDHYIKGTIGQYNELNGVYFDRLKKNSDAIEGWLRTNNCNSFINFAKNHFKNISFMFTSAIGIALVEGKLENKLSVNDPKCVLDPLLWALKITN